jgi:hypothetical protein
VAFGALYKPVPIIAWPVSHLLYLRFPCMHSHFQGPRVCRVTLIPAKKIPPTRVTSDD